jgi:O-acetyl-ADP-ribose deacetylase (regulator of RNase III)
VNVDLTVVEEDITVLDVDVIVNAANESLRPGGGVCGAIHRAAGPELAWACAESVRALGPCRTGKARITPGFDLPALWVVHAVGPVWQGGSAREAHFLAETYRYALRLAGSRGVATIAFPAISTGIFGYPLVEATKIAVGTVRETLPRSPSIRQVVFATFGEDGTQSYHAALAPG